MKGVTLRAESEEWRFRDALYISRGTNRGSLWGSGLLLMLFAAVVIVLLYLQADASSEGVGMAMIVWGIILVFGAAAFAISIKKNSETSNIIYFGVFKDYILILPTDRANKGKGYVQTPHESITGYRFIHYSTSDSHVMTDSYYNYGKLKITTSTSRYTTEIKNIKEAQKWMEKFVHIQ